MPENAIVPVLQGPLRGKRWVASAATHGCWLGTYEYRKQRLFAQSIRRGAVVYDLGANVGFYTLIAAIKAGAGGHVYAFEPLPRNLILLRLHLRLNGITTVEIVEAAVSDTVGVGAFAADASPSLGRLDPSGPLQVATVSLDEMVTEGRLQPPDVMKIDIEGGEMRALRGATRLLESRRPLIFLSTHGHRVREECCALLTSLGYELDGVDVAGAPSHEFVARVP